MILTQPGHTQADVHFQIAGIPVRVHPFFWVVAFLLSGGREPRVVAIWIAAMFVSILVHELGHAVLQRRHGGSSKIVLYGFGGLAVAEGVRATPLQHVQISLAGPFAGFFFAACLGMVVWMAGLDPRFEFPWVYYRQPTSMMADELLEDLFQINILWGLLNLLPIYPLDGGQVARELLTLFLPPGKGIVVSLWVSIVTAVAVALYFVQARGPGVGSLFPVLMFGLLAYSSYQMLQVYQDSRRQQW